MSVDVAPAAPRTAGRDAQLFVAGAWRDGAGWLDVVDPSTEERAGRVALAAPADVDEAVRAASAAFPAWAATPGHERGAVLARAAAQLEARADEAIGGLMREAGKTRADATGEVRRAADTLRWAGEEAGRVDGQLLQGLARDARRLLIPTPLGVVAAFTAWNFPAFLTARKVASALAAGCTVVLKPSERAPSAALAVVRALADAGVPAGALDVVFGEPRVVAAQLLGARAVRAVTFTGSTAVGREIAQLAAPDLKRCVLELGGHAPVIVAEDADLDLALRSLVPAKYGSAGQSCLAPSRVFVHERRYEEFVDGYARAARALRVGNPETDPAVQMGPVISAERLGVMARLTADALARGARVVCGGERAGERGFFWSPTVVADVPDDAELMREEPFGPISAVASFGSLEDAIRRANATGYAFGAYVFTGSLRTREVVLRDLRASNIGINQMAPSLPDAPLGGMLDSGYGYEGGAEGIRAFQHLRLVSETGSL